MTSSRPRISFRPTGPNATTDRVLSSSREGSVLGESLRIVGKSGTLLSSNPTRATTRWSTRTPVHCPARKKATQEGPKTRRSPGPSVFLGPGFLLPVLVFAVEFRPLSRAVVPAETVKELRDGHRLRVRRFAGSENATLARPLRLRHTLCGRVGEWEQVGLQRLARVAVRVGWKACRRQVDAGIYPSQRV
jgi:hypothetical protein